MMDDIRLEKYIDNTLGPILPEKIRGGNIVSANDTRVSSIGGAVKYSQK